MLMSQLPWASPYDYFAGPLTTKTPQSAIASPNLLK
jgi:hypothetical protein